MAHLMWQGIKARISTKARGKLDVGYIPIIPIWEAEAEGQTGIYTNFKASLGYAANLGKKNPEGRL